MRKVIIILTLLGIGSFSWGHIDDIISTDPANLFNHAIIQTNYSVFEKKGTLYVEPLSYAEFYYDTESRLTQALYRDDEGNKLTNLIYDYGDSGVQLSLQIFGANGKLSSKYDTAYDNNDNLLTESSFNGSELLKLTVYGYDSFGDLISITTYNQSLTIEKSIIFTHLRNDESLITNSRIERNGIMISNRLIEYNDNRAVVVEKAYDSWGILIENREKGYDSAGNLIAEITLIDRWEWEYSAEGNPIAYHYENSVAGTNFNYCYQYDNSLISEESYFENGKLRYYCRYLYDAKENLTNFSRYSDTGVLEFQTATEYDDTGHKIMVDYFFADSDYSWTYYYIYDSFSQISSSAKYICNELKELILYTYLRNN